LLHILEATELAGPDRNPLADYRTINAELARYAPELAEKPQIVVLNKTDATAPEAIDEHRRAFAQENIELRTMSAATGEGVPEVLEMLWSHIRKSSQPLP
jgi:GTP-binding protein